MEFHQLRYFLAVAKTGSFREAALYCHISQPAMSEQIQKLESQLERSLFERNHRGVILTPAGRILAERAAQIIDQVERAKTAVQAQIIQFESLQIGALPTIAPNLLSHTIAGFRQIRPCPSVIVREDIAPRVLEMLADGDLELGIVSLPAGQKGFVNQELFTEDLLLAVPVRHPLALKAIIHVEDLFSEKFILMSEEHCLCTQALSFCRAHGFQPNVTFQSSQLETVQSFVMAGEGVAFVPETAKCHGPLVYRPVQNGPRRTITAVWKSRTDQVNVLDEFSKFFREIAEARLNSRL